MRAAGGRARRAPAPRSTARLPRRSLWLLTLAALLASPCGLAPVARAASPALNYTLHCQGCHLADGRATPGAVPPLDGALGRLVGVPEGRVFLIRLPAIASTPLSDAETAELLNWLLRGFGASGLAADFSPFTEGEVARSRRPPLIDVKGARRAVLERLGRSEPEQESASVARRQQATAPP